MTLFWMGSWAGPLDSQFLTESTSGNIRRSVVRVQMLERCFGCFSINLVCMCVCVEVAQWVERTTGGLEFVASIPAPGARSLLAESVSILYDRMRQKSRSPLSISVWQHVKLSDVTRPRNSLVADEDVKKPTNQISVNLRSTLDKKISSANVSLAFWTQR